MKNFEYKCNTLIYMLLRLVDETNDSNTQYTFHAGVCEKGCFRNFRTLIFYIITITAEKSKVFFKHMIIMSFSCSLLSSEEEEGGMSRMKL